ncbi:MAG: galactokinase [Spirochaetaceae bacterium]|jgi:galactokinase|nr:galactokinase [Spirochaetaceae bacterium]
MLDIGHIHRKEYGIDAGGTERIIIAEAPGRIHYLGEHGEPKAGLFLSSGIDRYIRVALSPRKDNSFRFYAPDLGERKRTTLANLKYKREDRWSNYLKTPIHGFLELGYPVKGLNVTVAGDIPLHTGLASSSAIEVAAGVALREFFKAPLSTDELLAQIILSQKTLFEKPGIPIDYAIALYAEEDCFLVADETTLTVRPVPANLGEYQIILMDSRVPRMGLDNELRIRRQALKKGLTLLAQKKTGTSLRDFVTADLIESMGNLPEEIRRRSMHIIQELRRICDAEEALLKGDLPALSKLIFHSHESLRDLYEVSCPEIDWLVKRGQETEGVLGSRMTGLGFGGCTYTILTPKAAEEYRRRIEDYERIFGFRPIMHTIKLAQGARII